eukprot:superscaffoldBa00000114_g1666
MEMLHHQYLRLREDHGQERRHGWGATVETLLFLFWLASGALYRVVSRMFGMPRSTVYRMVHRITEEVVAIRHKVIHLPKTVEALEAVSRGFAGLARHRAFMKAAMLSVTIRAASLTPMWAGLGQSMTQECSATAHCTGVHSTFLQGTSSLQRIPVPPTPTPPHHFLHEASTGCESPAFKWPSFQGTLHYRACFWDDENQVPGHLPAALEVHHTFVPHVITACAVLHNICFGAGDIVALEDECEEDVEEDENGEEWGEWFRDMTQQPSIDSALQTQLMDDAVDSGEMHPQTRSGDHFR